MDLSALISDFETEALDKRLTEGSWRQILREQGKRPDQWRDGKLKFGTVSGTVRQVLARSDGSMRLIEIHEQVERLLGFPVARGSVTRCLSDEARHRRPRFERTGHGRYQALR